LTSLALTKTGIRDAEVTLLASAPQLSGLTALRLTINAIDSAGVQALAESPVLRRLTELDLRFIGFRDWEVQLLRSRFGRHVRLSLGLPLYQPVADAYFGEWEP
jgi:hypothetical protein